MQVLHFPHAKGPMQLQYDREWLAIMRSTTPLLPICRGPTRMPTINDPSRRCVCAVSVVQTSQRLQL